MVRVGVLISGVIAIIGAALGFLHGWDKMTGVLTGLNLSTLFSPQTFVGLIILAASVVAIVCSLLLLIDKLAVVDALIVLIWGILLLFFFGGTIWALIGAILLILGGLIGLITAIAS